MPPAKGLSLRGRGPPDLRPAILARALTSALALTLPLTLTLALAILAWLLRGCAVRDGSSAAAPPSASLPSGVTGRRIRSLIHASLLSLRSHIYEPLVLAMWSNVQKLAWLRSDTSLKSIQLRPSGAWKFRREERLHGKCGDWRTLLW